jgi:hypothetical protein
MQVLSAALCDFSANLCETKSYAELRRERSKKVNSKL